MICSNCGKDIPFEGTVCPYCKAYKSQDKKERLQGQEEGYVMAVVVTFVCGVLGFIIGNALLGLVGGLVCAVIALFAGAANGISPARKESGPGESVGSSAPVSVPQPTNQPMPLTPAQERSMLASGQYKKCAHCAEIIRAEARLCRFCGYDVPLPGAAGR